MFGLDLQIIILMALVAVAFGGLLFVFMFNSISSEANQARRLGNIESRDLGQVKRAVQRSNDAAKRRKTVQDSLSELEEKQKAKHGGKPKLKDMITQAGMKISLKQFYLYSAIFGVLCALAAFIFGFGPIVIIGVLFVCALGIPRWFVSFRRNRRFKAFMNEFPNAVDVIVRGVKAGLPLNDCLMVIANESKEPVKSEFVKIVEAQRMGLTTGESTAKLYENVPVPETNFFAIVIAIQGQAGGNLSEALSNLSTVLRDRKKLFAKIKAVSAEAKASAGIIGSLPIAVMFLIYVTTPDYISLLFTHQTGHMILGASVVWMAMGVLVMKKMINFDI